MDWDLRAEILEFAHYWPATFLAFLLGALIGFGLSYLFPTPYQAEAGLSVTYNGDFFPRNPDDYKNWYLGQLDVFVKSDGVIQDTLNRLQQEAPYWQTVSPESLRATLHTYWRNAGRWRLVAQASDPAQANQAVQAWQAAILERANAGIDEAARMMDLSNQYNAVVHLEAEAETRSKELAAVKEALQSWQASLKQTGSQSPLSTLDRWHLLTLTAQATSLVSTGQQLLTDPPAPETPAQGYLPWLDQTLASLEDELTIVQKQAADLSSQSEQLKQNWNEANDASAGLSAYMTVKSLSNDIQAAKQVRVQSAAALVGGVLGLAAWILIWLGRPLRRARK
jgi:hypothetical protein